MSYLKQHHPEIYEQIRIKPNFGPFYSGNVYKASIDYAKNHERLDDPIAERLLADYVEFYQKAVWIFGEVFILTTFGVFIWAVMAS